MGVRRRIINFIPKVLAALAAAVLIAAAFPPAGLKEVRAEYISDTLDVKVGYPGMELSEYVTVKSFHWTDFDFGGILPLQEISYSYSQGEGQTGYYKYTYNNEEGNDIETNYFYDSKEYRSIIATGYGFYVTDLLNYCNIYYGDIYNILFWVNDWDTIWTAMDKYSLFQQRYYFNNLPAHRVTVYNDFFEKIGYDFQGSWEDFWEVSPMLALESNWDTVNEMIEDHEPTEDGMSTATRFHLLYGQTYPTERITRESAKYVSAVYVTLNGSPAFGEIEDFDASLGSHTVKMEVSNVYNSDIRDLLSQFMDINSTDENVLRIMGYTIDGSSEYSDLATVTINYEVISEGDASISAGIGIGPNAQKTEVANTVKAREKDKTESGAEETGGGNAETGPQEKEPESGAAEETAPEPVSEAETAAAGISEEHPDEVPSELPSEPASETAAELPSEAEKVSAEGTELKEADSSVFKLSGDVMGNLKELINTEISVPPQDNIEQVNVEDNSAEKEERQRRILIWTGIVCLGVCAAGAAAGVFGFRMRLKYSGLPGSAPLKNKLDKFFFGIENKNGEK